MREIKFKVWNKVAKKMIPNTHLDTKNIINHIKWKKGSMFLEETDWFIFLEYTGLKDKNGEEIYEGDITDILAEDGKINRFIVTFGIAQREMASGWLVDIPSFYFDLIGGNFKAFPIVRNYAGKHDLKMTKIIGNIYENPELLEKEK